MYTAPRKRPVPEQSLTLPSITFAIPDVGSAITMTPLFVLLLLLHVTRSNIVFGDKSNADLYCRISDSAVDQLSIEPAKHVYTDDNGTYYYSHYNITPV